MNSKTTKRALLGSVVAMLVCFTMLLSTTFAWFTDTAVSASNKIVAGSLKIDLEVLKDGTWTSIKGSKAPIFDYDKWEPGYTDVKVLKVENEGTLALKWVAKFVSATPLSDLANVIDVYVLPSATEISVPADRNLDGYTKVGTVAQFVNSIEETTYGTLKAEEVAYLGIALKMQETAGNEYQEKSLGGAFDITIFATQETFEKDSFDDQYDKDARYDNFVGGSGTETDPYLIDAPSQLLNISENYNEYSYYKIADGVTTLDMTGIGKIKLNGSFDGNGVEMANLTTALFSQVGKVGEASDITISNFTATVNTTDGNALVRNIYNPGTTTFENVAIHGYIEGQYNLGSFYNYGTANAGGSEGADYTVSFVNATSDATLVCTTGNTIGGMLGHGYEGADYKVSINMDANSGFSGEMYTNAGTCYAVMGMCSHATYILNGVEISRYDNTYPHSSITVSAPTAEADGYYVAPVANADHYVVFLNSQLTAYDENGVKIANESGLTWNLGKETVTALDGKLFDLFTSAEIINDSSDSLGYELDGGVLKIYSGRDTNYASGWITLQVNQYDANGTLLATGTLTVYTFPEL